MKQNYISVLIYFDFKKQPFIFVMGEKYCYNSLEVNCRLEDKNESIINSHQC